MKTFTIRKINSIINEEISIREEDLLHIKETLNTRVSSREEEEYLEFEESVITNEIETLNCLKQRFKK